MPTFLYFATIFLTPGSLLPIFAQVEEAQLEAPVDDGEAAEADEVEQEAEPTPLPTVAEAEAASPTPASDEPAPAQSDMAAQLAQRAQIRDVHRAFGIATWFSMAGTLILGGIQIGDDYGPFAGSPVDTPCTQGTAILPDYCFDAVPVPHLVSAALTSALYYTTFALSFFMPDPLGSADSPGWGGERLRIHKTLRWLHFAGMVITSIFGAVTANLSPTDVSFADRQALAITHFGLGLTTYGLLTAAAAVMVF
jgi:hypothetical protein